MRKYRIKPLDIEAVTFMELVQYGKKVVPEESLVNGMPWSFDFEGYHVTHENDKLYLLCSADKTIRFHHDSLLVRTIGGKFICLRQEVVELLYAIVEPLG